MKDRSFIDTNVLVYTDDSAYPEKQAIATALLAAGWNSGNLVLSTQVIQEYFVASTRKLGVSPKTAQRKIELLAHLDIVSIEHSDIVQAIGSGYRYTPSTQFFILGFAYYQDVPKDPMHYFIFRRHATWAENRRN